MIYVNRKTGVTVSVTSQLGGAWVPLTPPPAFVPDKKKKDPKPTETETKPEKKNKSAKNKTKTK